MTMRVALLFLAFIGATALVSPTPIQKVVTMLDGLKAKVFKQGQLEEIQYSAYKTFCKGQTATKEAAIAKFKKNAEVWEATIASLDASIKSLGGDIAENNEAIQKANKEIQKSEEKRAAAHAKYTAQAKDLNEAISSCDEAIENMKGSKGSMTGADLDLQQLKATVVKAGATPEAMKEAVKLVQTVAKAAQVADKPAVAFKYQSNAIIATIEKLQSTFKANKMDLDMDEHTEQSSFDKKTLGLSNQVSFLTKEKNEKEALSASKDEEKSETNKALQAGKDAEQSDQAFLKELKSECTQKGKDFAQRSKSIAAELKAMTAAIATLNEGAVDQYSANKKLVGLVLAKKVSLKDARPVAKVAPSFIQVQSVDSQAAVIQRVLVQLDTAASRLHSPTLSAISLKVVVKADHFSNVRALIKDLLTKLKADAKAEASTKAMCDKEMKKSVDARDKAKLNIEDLSGLIARQNAVVAAKTTEIEDLANQIATMNQDLVQAGKMRAAEKAENTETMKLSKQGAAAVKGALKTLGGYYNKELLQTSYTPPTADRYGETVAEVAPEAFSGEYHGRGAEAKGIIGILEVIKSDFENNDKETSREETEAASEFKKYSAAMNKDITAKTKDKAGATTAKENAEGAVQEANDGKNDEEELHAGALSVLDKLSAMCVDGEETYEERVAKRQGEIASLKDAMQIFDDWQK